MRLLDMAGLRMHVLPVAIDWNADIQLPVGLSGAGLEGAAACFDDGPVAVEGDADGAPIRPDLCVWRCSRTVPPAGPTAVAWSPA